MVHMIATGIAEAWDGHGEINIRQVRGDTTECQRVPDLLVQSGAEPLPRAVEVLEHSTVLNGLGVFVGDCRGPLWPLPGKGMKQVKNGLPVMFLCFRPHLIDTGAVVQYVPRLGTRISNNAGSCKPVIEETKRDEPTHLAPTAGR